MIYLLDLLLQYWPEMGLIFTDIVCRNGIPLTDNKYMYECIFLWCRDIDNGNGTLVILLCGWGGNLSQLTCISVCVTGHWSVRYIWIMRWWCSNLGQWPLQNLGSVDYCYIAYFWTCPAPSSCRLMSLQEVVPILPHLSIHQCPPCHHTGSSAHPGLTRLRTRIPWTPHLPFNRCF